MKAAEKRQEQINGQHGQNPDLNEESTSASDESLSSTTEMTDFETENGTDLATAQEKTSSLKVPWDDLDIVFWFSQFENHLENAGVKAQWTKRMILQRQLDPRIQVDCKDILAKKK